MIASTSPGKWLITASLSVDPVPTAGDPTAYILTLNPDPRTWGTHGGGALPPSWGPPSSNRKILVYFATAQIPPST